MLSYRHAFHAGNHADVLKHITLIECLSLLSRKEKGFLAIDTHAGAGDYTLTEGYAAQNREWDSGVERLRLFDSLPRPRAVEAYLKLTERYAQRCPAGYPGSPSIISGLLRSQDRAVFCELHPADHEALERRFGDDRSVRVRRADGLAELKALLPPPTRRGLVFIDPSYELAADYDQLISALREALKRFAEGTYLVWYPLLERAEAKELPQRLADLGAKSTLRAEFKIRDAQMDERGMSGSGLFLINPPWTLETSLREALPYLAQALRSEALEPWTLQMHEK